MIYVERTTLSEPPELITGRATELVTVRAYYSEENIRQLREAAALSKPPKAGVKPKVRATTKASRPKDPKSYGFKAYLAAKAQLEGLFHKKCAYCESKYKAVLTGEVEHYRPKGRIQTKDGKFLWPGYYWLAATWTNLVPVCAMCNKLHKVTDLTDGKEKTAGKGDRFPLVDEKRRARPEDEPKDEEPLLLDPCWHKPDEHLQFFEGEKHRALLRGLTDEGQTTVDILALNRTDLVGQRLEHLLRLEGLMRDIQRAQGQATSATNDVQREIALAEIKDKKDQLEAYQDAGQEYAALARYAVQPFLAKMNEIAEAAK